MSRRRVTRGSCRLSARSRRERGGARHDGPALPQAAEGLLDAALGGLDAPLRFATAIGFDLDAPLTFALTATPDAVRLDQSVAVTDEEVVGEGPPSCSRACPPIPGPLPPVRGALEAFQAAVDLGVEQAAAEDGVSPAQAQEAIRERFGLDTDELAAAMA